MNRAKQRGTAFETLITRFLRDRLGDGRIDRMPLKGTGDEGDIAGIRTLLGEKVTVECKAHSRFDLAGWLDEAQTEAGNADAHVAVVIFKRRGKGLAKDQYVLMDVEALSVLLGADKEWED